MISFGHCGTSLSPAGKGSIAVDSHPAGMGKVSLPARAGNWAMAHLLDSGQGITRNQAPNKDKGFFVGEVKEIEIGNENRRARDQVMEIVAINWLIRLGQEKYRKT